jgi:hypothetical protein
MLKLFISYARADGAAAAARLRTELELAGLTVWRDLEDMRGGSAWKEQLRAALREVDAVLVLLTPASTASEMVTWEWENALTLQKPVISLLILPCKASQELSRLHYHDLSQPELYSAGLAKLIRDLLSLQPAQRPPETSEKPASKIVIYHAEKSAIGENPVVINAETAAPVEPDLLKLLAETVIQVGELSTDRQSLLRQDLQQIQLMVRQLHRADGPVALARSLETALQEINLKLKELQAGQKTLQNDLAALQNKLLTHFDKSEKTAVSGAIHRLDRQQLTAVEAVLIGLETEDFSNDEAQQALSAVQASLLQLKRESLTFPDPALAQDVDQIAEIIDAPYLEPKHRLKVTIPIIPLFVAYEGEIEVKSALNLEKVWQSLVKRFRRQ